MSATYSKKDVTKTPNHLAIIMDGNGRWAKKNNLSRTKGHEKGAESAKLALEFCLKNKIPYLTLYTFSLENWYRPTSEVDYLFKLLTKSLDDNIKEFDKKDIRFNVIGELDNLSVSLKKKIDKIAEHTKKNTTLTLILALSYSSKMEIVNAVNKCIEDTKDGKLKTKIDENIFSNYLYTYDVPDVDLLIRTGYETRISNFLLWQIAYAELFFLDIYWPEIKESHFQEVLIEYANRERRFGKISEQIENN